MPMRSSHLPRTALYESWNRLGLPRAESILPGAQLIHATTWALPPTSLPLAVTVHDLANPHLDDQAGHLEKLGMLVHRAHVVVTLTDGAKLDSEGLRAYAKKHLTAYKVPRRYVFRESLPKTNVGKVLRRMLRDEPTPPDATA